MERSFESFIGDAVLSAPEKFEGVVRSLVGRPLVFAYNNNKSQLIAYRDDRQGVRHVRVSRILLLASPEVWREFGLWVRNHRKNKILNKGSRSREFIDSPSVKRLLETSRRKGKPRPLNPVGEVYDLKKVFDDLNERFFEGRCDSSVGYSKIPGRARSRSIRLGIFKDGDNVIAIHPVLDWKKVPRFVVEATVFHEMAHWLLKDERHPSGRRVIHSGQFFEHMNRFPENERAEAWIDKNMAMLIKKKSRLVRKRR